MKLRILSLITICLFFGHAYSQCLQYEVPLQQRVQRSTVIVEGVVEHAQATWDIQQAEIFTVHKVKVTKVFKGSIGTGYLEVATEGGMVGTDLQQVHPSLHLEPGYQGLFLLELRSDIPDQFGMGSVYLSVAAEQGFIKYLETGEARDPFHSYSDIQVDLYSELATHIGQPYQTIAPLPSQTVNPRSLGRRLVPPIINSITPSRVTAGTFTEITIQGDNFGTSGTVEFANADNGGAGYIVAPSTHIQSWSNNEIRTWVPSNAGTGTIRITNNTSDDAVSDSILTIDYDIFTFPFGVNTNRTVLRAIDANNGYLFQFNNNFDNNAAAVAAVERAFETWQCGTGVAFEISPVPTDSACNRNDGVNVIAWDTACALPMGVLGRSTTTFSICSPPFTGYLVDTDIRFTQTPGGTGWNFGPGNPGPFQYDFETVALHEIGHSHQLGHIIAPGKVMHYSIFAGTTQRVLDHVSDIGGGSDVMSLSTMPSGCGPQPIVPVNPTNCSGIIPVASFNAIPNSGCAPLEVTFIDQSTGGVNTWEWDIDNNGSVDYTSDSFNHTYTQPGTYSVKLKVSNSSDSDSITVVNLIEVYPSPIADAGADTTACAGQRITVGGNPTGSGGTGSISYQWSPAGPLSSSALSNPTAIVQSTTIFTVVITDDLGCTDQDSTTITTNSNPIADAGATVSICQGQSQSIGGNPSASGGAGGYSYLWSPGIYFNDSTAANPVVTPNTTFVATLEVTDQLGCTDSDTVTVFSLATPLADAGSDVSNCQGAGGVTIGGNPSGSGGAGGYTYLWLPFGNLSNSGAANPVANPPSSVVYTLIVFDAQGCSDTSTMNFDVVPNPTADAGADDTICVGEVIQIGGSPTASSGTSGYSYNWTPALHLNNPNIANPLASPPVTTTYKVVVTDANGCFDVDSMTVFVNPKPVVDAGSDTSLCSGTVSITLGGNPTAVGSGPFTYSWSPSGLGLSGPNPMVTPTATSSYTLEVTDANNCVGKDSVTVSVSGGVRAYISGPDTICFGDCAVLQAQPLSGTPPFSYSWSIGATNNPITVCPTITTTYFVTVTDGLGCSHDTSKTVTVLSSPPAEIIGLDTVYCESDDAVTVSLSPSGGVFSGNGVAGNTFDPGVAGVGVHVLTYEVTSANGCVGLDSIVVEVLADPVKPTITLLNDTLFTVDNYASYKWIFNGVPIASATDTFFHVTAMGDYAVEVTNSNGCTIKSDDVFVDPTGIDLLTGIASIDVYPNPSDEYIWVRIEANENIEPLVRVVSVGGAIVYEQLEPNQSDHLIQIPVAELSAGLYLLEIRADQGSRWQRIVVE